MIEAPMLLPILDDEEGDSKGEKKEEAGPNMTAKMLKSRTIICSKGVDDKLATATISQLILLEQEDPEALITVVVNSPGGSADSGFAIYDAMRFVSCPIRTIVMGLCASAGVMIYLGGDKGQRFCTPSARFLLHQPSMRAMGQASDLEIISTEIDRLKLLYNTIVAENTGKTPAEVEKDVNRDFWLSAKAAKDYGLVSKVITKRGDMPAV
jgi:ATP-dependent Clp protease protease subunit